MPAPLSYTPYKPSNAVAEALAGATHASGVPYPGSLSQYSAPFTKKGDDVARWQMVLDRLYHMMGLHVERTSTPLQVGVTAGAYTLTDGTRVSFTEDTIAIADALTAQKLWIDVATNALDQGAAWPSTETDYLPLAEIDTAGGVVTQIRDMRGMVWNRLPPTSVDAGTTGQPYLTTDADNAGAGVDGGLRHNRGTDGGGEDAEFGWDETNDRWNAKALHTTGTLAPVNALKVQISGTDLLDASGAAKVQSGVAGAGLTHTSGVLTPHVDGTTIEVNGSDELALVAGGITPAKLSDAIADKLVQITIPDSSGASPRQVTIQAKDLQGNALAEVVYLCVRVCQDADGANLASDATIAVGGGIGALVRSETAGKDLAVKTDSSGQVRIDVTDGTLETVYLLAAPTTRSKLLDCADIGTVTIA